MDQSSKLNGQFSDPYINYRVPTNPLYLYEDKFIGIEYIYPEDIQSIGPIPKDEAISIYGCKGFNPMFKIKLQPESLVHLSLWVE